MNKEEMNLCHSREDIFECLLESEEKWNKEVSIPLLTNVENKNDSCDNKEKV